MMTTKVSAISSIPSACFGVTAIDPQTGVLLDDTGNWAKDGSGCFYVFETIEAAKWYCSQKLVEDPLTEWSIFDDAGEQVGRFADDKAVEEAIQKKAEGRRNWLSRLFK